MVVRDIVSLLKKGGEERFLVSNPTGYHNLSKDKPSNISIYDSRIPLIVNKPVLKLRVVAGLLEVTI